MENLYNRIEKLDEAIRSVKLPYMAWKVLFLIDKDTQVSSITDILEADEIEVQSSVAVLLENGLIEEKQSDGKDKQEEDAAEIAAVEETSVASSSFSDSKNLEKEVDSVISDDLDFNMEETFEESAQEVEDIIDEAETELEVLPEEEIPVDEIQGNEPTEEENIEINISDDEMADESDDMEFNFNLTGEGAGESSETIEAETQDDAKTKEKVIAEPAKEEPAIANKAGNKKILVIDDSLVIRKMVEIALEEEDYDIVTAVSGKEGLDALDKNNPDLVILDMMLPDINGIEILKTIKASRGIPVIMLSGKDSPQMIETAKKEGAEEFLPKPFKDDDLVDKIKKLLQA